jgi:hypothetical protein
MSDAEDAVAAFIRFDEAMNNANLQLEPADTIQLMIAERLNVIAGNLADVQDRLYEIVNRMPGY